MADCVKLGPDNTCPGCEDVPKEDFLECTTCNSLFHVICNGVSTEFHLGTRTMVKTFYAKAQFQHNFKFFCNSCLTKFERNIAESESQKVKGLETKVGKIEEKIDEITKILSTNNEAKAQNTASIKNIWQDEERLSLIKLPLENSVLVVKKTDNPTTNNENNQKLEKTMLENNVPLKQSYRNKNGDLVMVCDTKDKRNELKEIVSSSIDNELLTPDQRKPAITIVGLNKEYEKQEIIQMLVLQNGVIRKFANSNDIKNHIEIKAIRPLKNNQRMYQAFATVSKTLREGFQHLKDKVTLGLRTCKVYDRYFVKRCYNCQLYGHFANDCPTPQEKSCGKCGENHTKERCEAESPNCINCIRNGKEDCAHEASSHNCPSYLTQLNEIKKKNKVRSNLTLNKVGKNNPPQR